MPKFSAYFSGFQNCSKRASFNRKCYQLTILMRKPLVDDVSQKKGQSKSTDIISLNLRELTTSSIATEHKSLAFTLQFS